ncbi:MAG: MoxR family ATPase [Actinomycetota bacterium]
MADLADTTAAFRRLVESAERVIAGATATVEGAVVCLFAEGNLLLEGVPGVGKTMLARSLARSMGGSFRRVQCTPDLLPSDVTGTSIYDQERREFRFVPGPVFANVVLVDEINRTTPRTQSALLEPMEERQATVEGVAHELPSPFFLIATENPVEHHGTYPLPEGQLDRFTMSVRLDYPDEAGAREVVTRQLLRHPIEDLESVMSSDEIVRHQAVVRSVHVEPSIVDYAIALVGATRSHPDVWLGASPRATVSLTRCAQALAAAGGRDYVLPDDVKALAPAVLAHRVILKPQKRLGPDAGRAVIQTTVAEVPVPLGVAGQV